jgi:chromate reductase
MLSMHGADASGDEAGDTVIRVLGVCGSLRKNSYNKLLLQAALMLAPGPMKIEIYEGLNELPPFNQDFEHDLPHLVRDFKTRVRNADGVLFVTPEYNHSLPGTLKNAIDWLSRPSADNSLAKKPVAVFGCGSSQFGAVRLQIAFREILSGMDADLVMRPEVIVFNAQDRFGLDGELTDSFTINVVRESLQLLKDRIAVRRP